MSITPYKNYFTSFHRLLIILTLLTFLHENANSQIILNKGKITLREFCGNGWIVLTNNDTIKGEVYFNSTTNTVRYKSNEEIGSSHAFNTPVFKLNDEEGVDRLFYSIPLENDEGKANYYFFEFLVQGKLNLLCNRNTYISWTKNEIGANYFGFEKETELFCLIGEDLDIVKFIPNNRFFDLYFNSKSDQMKRYNSKLKFSTSTPIRRMKLIQYYNSLE